MNVLVTGAAGVLGREVAKQLRRNPDLSLRLTDRLPIDTPDEGVPADLADPEACRTLCEGVDQVMHIAAIHPWKPYTPAQYLECNITATHNILAAAAETGVSRVIYTSSIAAMGMARNTSIPMPWNETKPWTADGDLYGLTKHVGEDLCEMFRTGNGLTYLALRPGTFIPRAQDDPVFGFGLLSSWVHPADVAQAHVLALQSDAANEAIIVTSRVPFVEADTEPLLADAPAVIRRYFPEAAELERNGIALPAAIERCYDVSKAERLLGYRPACTFDTWLHEMTKGANREGEHA